MYLSIVVVTRNDNYGLLQHERLKIFLDSLPENKNVQLVLVEWNPIYGKKTMKEILDEHGLKCNYKIITVPKSIHDEYNATRPVIEYIGKNVGIHHADGEYVLLTNPDVKLPNELWTYKFSPNFFYRCARTDVYTNVITDGKEFENSIKVHHGYNGESIFHNGSGDFTLLNTEVARKLKGYKETTVTYTHLDSEFLDRCYFKGNLGQLVLPFRLYHVDHERILSTLNQCNINHIQAGAIPEVEHMGLSHRKLEISTYLL